MGKDFDEYDDFSDEELLVALTQAVDAAAEAALTGNETRGNSSNPLAVQPPPSQFSRRTSPPRPVSQFSQPVQPRKPGQFSQFTQPAQSGQAGQPSQFSQFNQTAQTKQGGISQFSRGPARTLSNTSNRSYQSNPTSKSPTTSPERPRQPAAPRTLQRHPSHTQTYRQTTLFGGTLREDPGRITASQTLNNRPYLADLPLEPPTHHKLNESELGKWVYPLNLGPIRDYQFSIVKNALFHNTLVALPTGLGKTFIAATVMLNFFRWTKDAKIVFAAPTKPLVSQQVEACLNVAGIPRSQTTLLTGETSPSLRREEWETKRLFFMTPQTLMNDLSIGSADPKSIVLLVIDEAHRATGDYAYVKVIEFMRRFNKSFRVLALTATPGSTVEGVQEVIDNLCISHVEIRTEESIDIRQYVHSRNIETVTFDPSDEMEEVKSLFSKALKPLVDKLSSQNIYYGRDPMSLTTYGLLKSRNEWLAGPGRHANQGLKFMIMSVFGILQSVAHSIKLLNFHGIKPFYYAMAEFRSTEEAKGERGSKLKRQLLNDESFQKMMTMIEKWMKLKDFHGHPKLTYLCQVLVNHFADAGEGSNTRAIVFAEYRDSAEEIVRLLNTQPMVSATVFVGQADSKRSEGMKQKQQIETIEKFKSGQFNVLVATSIGEEGLDIGQVDLIICYDASSSPIRMLQRMGRTGRKRAGNIVLLLMKGKEEEKFAEAKDNYQKMQQLICDGASFTFRHELSARIIPRDIKPEVDKRHIDIPIENTQDKSLPEPKKTPLRGKKKPLKKKFHMPDGVITGFIKASEFGQHSGKNQAGNAPKEPSELEELADIPRLDRVFLDKDKINQLNRRYKTLPRGQNGKTEEIDASTLTASPMALVALTRTSKIKHSDLTKRCVQLFQKLKERREKSWAYEDPCPDFDPKDWQKLPMTPYADDTDGGQDVDDHDESSKKSPTRPRQTKRGRVPSSGASSPAGKVTKKRRIDHNWLDDCAKVVDDDDEEAAASATTTPAHGRGHNGKGGRTPSSIRGRIKRVGDHLEDIGDDCTRTSDMAETDGSDSGGDLADFIVDDDVPSSALRVRSSGDEDGFSSSLPASSGLSLRLGKQEKDEVEEKPFWEPTKFDPTQDSGSDDEMPDLDQIVESAKKEKQKQKEDKGEWKEKATSRVARTRTTTRNGGDEENEDEEPRPSPRKPLGKRRKQILTDSEDDE
ncbi:ATP-dependent DNA helicase-like protein [Thermochaetoides thermophila DSM 1495]|uniref:ATP-dependent DNA helicase n=1 Tax=Chaetomium thermophilum (strain DSM 1495 / CBS 144.50 / IMI 039719) TaxID=759272 RepID=G0SET3_CHATD|nr:ATP-dependent DNA helicase-like protein [Thermochaetoides thermophila DSM 1495]EGS17949.1 ATP-dependent DNA helicase-like protein [Thermochaetoides thermophila DSM 1495]